MKNYEYGDPKAKTVLIQPVDDHDLSAIENEIGFIRERTILPFRLIAVKVDNWNDDLSPWSAPPVFGDRHFGGGAPDTLKELLKLCPDDSRTYILGGYSLAGLFALWAAYQTERFSAVAAASPSMWFPGLLDYMKQHEIRTSAVYLSLGDREEKTRNSVMAAVGNCIREGHERLRTQGVECTLEWNPGNHFKEPDLRTAKAFVWAMERLENKPQLN